VDDDCAADDPIRAFTDRNAINHQRQYGLPLVGVQIARSAWRRRRARRVFAGGLEMVAALAASGALQSPLRVNAGCPGGSAAISPRRETRV
jgi:hypothetical protein